MRDRLRAIYPVHINTVLYIPHPLHGWPANRPACIQCDESLRPIAVTLSNTARTNRGGRLPGRTGPAGVVCCPSRRPNGSPLHFISPATPRTHGHRLGCLTASPPTALPVLPGSPQPLPARVQSASRTSRQMACRTSGERPGHRSAIIARSASRDSRHDSPPTLTPTAPDSAPPSIAVGVISADSVPRSHPAGVLRGDARWGESSEAFVYQ